MTRYYGIDFGNAVTNVARLDTSAALPFRPIPLTHEVIGFHYTPEKPKTLFPSRLLETPTGVLVGQAAQGPGTEVNLKARLRNDTDDEIVRLCGAYFRGLLEALALRFQPEDRVVLTIPAFEQDEVRAQYIARFEQVWHLAIDDFAALKTAGVFAFCDEALASAVGHRVFQSLEEGDAYNILCLDIGSLSADAVYFETTHFHDVQQDATFNLRVNNLPLAGSDIDHWLLDYAKSRDLDVELPECEQVKIMLSRVSKPSWEAIHAGWDNIVNPAKLNEVLNEHGFYDNLADLCLSLLPEYARERTFLEKQLYYVITGGTSQLPQFGQTLFNHIWHRLFGEYLQITPQLNRRLRPSAYGVYEGCVVGAAWWYYLAHEHQRSLPVSDDRSYALRLFQRGPDDRLKEYPVEFLKRGEPITERVIGHYRLIPAHTGQTFYHVEVISVDDGGNHKAEGFLRGALSDQQPLVVELEIEPLGKLKARVNNVVTDLFYL